MRKCMEKHFVRAFNLRYYYCVTDSPLLKYVVRRFDLAHIYETAGVN